MFLEILQPQGDPFAEPQVLMMNLLVETGVMTAVADRLDNRLNLVRQIARKPEIDCQLPESEKKQSDEIHEEIAKIERFMSRFLLLWNVLMKFCADLFPKHFPVSKLIILTNGCMEQIDPICKNKKVQIEYVKFLRKLLCQSDDSVTRTIVESSHFITVIKKVNKKENMLSAQVKAVFEEMKKIQWFKLHQQFVEFYKDTLDQLKVHNKAVETLVNHNKRIRGNSKFISHTDSENHLDTGYNIKQPVSEPDISKSPKSAPEHFTIVENPEESDMLKNLENEELFGNIKRGRSLESLMKEYGDDLNIQIVQTNTVPNVLDTDPNQQNLDLLNEQENSPKIDLNINLGKRKASIEEGNEEMIEFDELPEKRISA